MEPTTPFTVRELQASDAPAMRKLFADVFGKEMPQALWDWKYARAQSVALGVWRGDELVAHYGGMGTWINCKGKAATAVQICDVMVSPAVRHGVRRQSPFFLATSLFIDRYIGYNRPWLLGYGFPNDRHMDLAARLRLYAPVGRMYELGWNVEAPVRAAPLLKLTSLDLANYPRHRSTVEQLGAQQRAELDERIVVHKDAVSVEWRYLRNPQEHYELVLVTHRITNKPIGLCVFKREAERVLWMEVLASRVHLPALAQVARAITWRLERRRLVLWCSAPDIASFGNVDSTQALAISTPTNVWRPGPAPAELLDHWWLLAGDTEYL